MVVPLACAELAAKVLVTHDESAPTSAGRRQPLSPQGVLEHRNQLWWILGGGLILSVMGLIDDRKNLHWLPRLAVQIGVACALVFGADVHATVFVPQSLAIVPKLLERAVDPGAGQLVQFPRQHGRAFVGHRVDRGRRFRDRDAQLDRTAAVAGVAGLMLVLIGSLTGFLCHNWHPARIFMGDTGSYFIGLLMSCGDVVGNVL